MNERPMRILLVEDNPLEVRLAREALAEAQVQDSLEVARDGIEALECLRRQGRFVNALRPDLILLDLNMPRMNGRELLREIKSDPNLRRIPVVVLTTSQDVADISQAYDLRANCYIPKPVDLERFVEVIRTVHHFWKIVATLPRE